MKLTTTIDTGSQIDISGSTEGESWDLEVRGAAAEVAMKQKGWDACICVSKTIKDSGEFIATFQKA